MFGKKINLKKYINIITDLIDVKEKIKIFYIRK
jgi:hypothetical protein